MLTMNWAKLLTNQCPKCDKMLFPNHTTLDLVKCGGFCNFSIRYGKLVEMQSNMQRGYSDDFNKKTNPAYKKRVATNKKINKWNKLQKKRVKVASNLQEEERLTNLRRREAGSRL